MTRVCIVTYKFMHRHHTMVNFHIEHLFSGNSCVCCRDETQYQTVQRPLLLRNAVKRHPFEPVVGAVVKLKNKIQKLPAASIYGSERRAILEFLDREKVDVVLCEFGCLGAELAESIGGSGIPIFTYYRGYDATMRVRSARQRNLIARAFEKMTGVFFVSSYLRDNLARYGLEHPNSHVIPSGVNTDKFVPTEKKKNKFIAVGRLIDKKRPDLTVEAFCKEAKTFPEASLDVLGGGPWLDECRQIVKREAMEKQVNLLGEQPHEIVMQHLQEAEFFLQHSVTSPDGDAEGAPTSIQEAMSCGCIILATRHAGIPGLVEEGETGYLVDELDQKGYREIIGSALNGSYDTDRMSRSARDFALSELDNRRLIKRVESVLKAGVQS